MTGIGIGRFAKRNASKTTEAALSGAAAKVVVDPSRVPDTITLAAAMDGTNDSYFPQQEDHHDNDDFCFWRVLNNILCDHLNDTCIRRN